MRGVASRIRASRLLGVWIGAAAMTAAAAAAGDPVTTRAGILVVQEGSPGRAALQFDDRVVVGEKSRWSIYYWCYQNGKYIKDTVTPKIAGYPKGRGEEKPTFTPKTVPTTLDPNNPPGASIARTAIDTKFYENPDRKSTRPGIYTLDFMGTGPKCADYGHAYAQIQIVPKITTEVASNGKDKDVVWWFDNADPNELEKFEYTMRLKLIAHGEDETYLWKITEGPQYVGFLPSGAPEKTVSGSNLVKVKSTAKNASVLGKGKGDFQVTVTVNEAESDPIKLRVKRPYRAVPLRTEDGDLSTHGYLSIIYYELRDQFNKVLPKKVPKREHFTLVNGKVEKDFAGTNWDRVPEAGSSAGAPGILRDEITGQKECVDPFCINRFKPRAVGFGVGDIDPVIHWSGWVAVGSEDIIGNKDDPAAKPIGVKIMSLTWQKFRDRARHCDIRSPLSEALKCPCAALRQSGNCP